MIRRITTKPGCARRAIILLTVALPVICGSLGLGTRLIVRQAEARYPASDFVTVEAASLHYTRAGVGRPVVLLHGGSGQLQDFSTSPVYPPLTNEFSTIAFDRPGLGYSEKPADEALTPEVQARLLFEALGALGIQRPLLVGQSWGGVVALAYALEYPESVSGIVLMGVAPYPRARRTDPFYALARLPVIGDLLVHTLFVPIGRYLLSPALLKQGAASFAPLDQVPPGFYAKSIALGLRPAQILAEAEESVVIPASLDSLSKRLPEIAVPVTILVGELDPYAFEQAARLEQDLPGSVVIVVADAAHYFWYAYPDVVVEAVRNTWERVEQE